MDIIGLLFNQWSIVNIVLFEYIYIYMCVCVCVCVPINKLALVY